MTEPQVWVLIGVFAASMFGMITIVTVSFTRTLNAALDAVRSEISGLREVVNVKLDLLDRDIQAISRRVFGAE